MKNQGRGLRALTQPDSEALHSGFEPWVSGLIGQRAEIRLRSTPRSTGRCRLGRPPLRARASGTGFRVPGFGFRVSNFRLRVSDFGFRISDFGFRVSDFGLQVLVLTEAASDVRHLV